MHFFLFSHQQKPTNNNYKFLRITPKLLTASESSSLLSSLRHTRNLSCNRTPNLRRSWPTQRLDDLNRVHGVYDAGHSTPSYSNEISC